MKINFEFLRNLTQQNQERIIKEKAAQELELSNAKSRESELKKQEHKDSIEREFQRIIAEIPRRSKEAAQNGQRKAWIMEKIPNIHLNWLNKKDAKDFNNNVTREVSINYINNEVAQKVYYYCKELGFKTTVYTSVSMGEKCYTYRYYYLTIEW